MKEREAWVDVAKGISIILVVLWHATREGDIFLFYFNKFSEGLIFLRMPLFFFISGFFIKKSLNLDFKTFLKKKILNTVYLYLLWGNIFVFLLNTIKSRSLAIHNPFEILIYPPPTFWFLYALVIGIIFIYFISKIPDKYSMMLVFIMYVVFSYNAEWRSVNFLLRIGRLVPFMYLGMIMFPYLNENMKKWYKLYFLILLVPFLCYFVMFSDLRKIGIITFSVSLLSIISTCFFSCFISRFNLKNLFIVIGRNSLYIYILHRFVFILLAPIFEWLIFPPFGTFFVTAVLGVSIPLILKKYLIKKEVNYLFNINYKKLQYNV